MKKKFKYLVWAIVVGMLSPWSIAHAVSSYELYYWSLNINGTAYETGDALPGYVDMSAFDEQTGLGHIMVSMSSQGGGDYSILAFFDHEIDDASNTFLNELGLMHGDTPPGMSWEIDEPGYLKGDIYNNFLAGSLDNSIGISIDGDTTFPDDVSMAIGWQFSLLAGESATVKFVLDTSEIFSPSIEHFDPDSQKSIFLGSDLTTTTAEVPEPATATLLAISMLLGKRRLSRRRRK